MASWLRRISSDPDNVSIVFDALDYFEAKLDDGLKELEPKGKVWDKCTMVPGLQAYWIGKWRELQSILEHLELRSKKAYTAAYKNYLTSYKGRELSDIQAKRFAEGDETVLAVQELMIEFRLLSAKFEGLTAGLHSLHFQMTNIVRLKTEGFEDAML